MLSPATIFLSRGSFSQIPPLAGDEDFGLVAGKDLTQLVSLQAYSCVECGRCTEHCPAANTGKVLNPKEIILGVRGYLNDFGPASEEPLLGKYNSQEAAFQCTTCGACEFQCPVGIEHCPSSSACAAARSTPARGKTTTAPSSSSPSSAARNALGMSAAERDKFIQKQELPIFDGTQEYCLWLGCMGGYDPKGREIIADFARVMNYLGTTFGVLRKEKCTGDPVRRLGNDLVFQQLAEANLEALAQNKVKKIVSICPHCVRTIQEDWKEFGTPARDRAPQRIPGPLTRTQLPKPDPNAPREKIVFHDPCYLGRYRDVYDEPRAVVALAGELVEAPRTHERSFCCGAGGGLAFLGEETGERVSHVRAEELVATGATTIGTACPFCNTMFRDARRHASTCDIGRHRNCVDIAQLTASRRLPPRPPPIKSDTIVKPEHSRTMKIIVAIKQVPERDAQVRIDARGKWIEEADLQFAMNESDAYALEEALQLKEKHGGEVIVLSAGPERVGNTIREALAKGADRAIHVDCDDLGRARRSRRRAPARRRHQDGESDLILTGLQSDDLGLGQTGVILAELLGLAARHHSSCKLKKPTAASR